MHSDELTAQLMHQPPYVLVVEDHAATAEMLTMILEDEGYEVSSVDSGNAALGVLCLCPSTQAEHPQPDVLLLDLTLPDMSAVDMMERLHEHNKNGASHVPPVVLLSAKQYQAVQLAADQIGAAAVVRKPFALETLLDGIKVALSRAE